MLVQHRPAHRQPALVHPGEQVGRPQAPAIDEADRTRLAHPRHPPLEGAHGHAEFCGFRLVTIRQQKRRVVAGSGLAWFGEISAAGAVAGQHLADMTKTFGQLPAFRVAQVIEDRANR